jgi:hypothetical protein
MSRRKFLIGLLLLMTLTGEVLFMFRTELQDRDGRTRMPNHTSKVYRAHPRPFWLSLKMFSFSGKARSKGAFPRKRTGKRRWFSLKVNVTGRRSRLPQLSSRREQALWSPIHVIHSSTRRRACLMGEGRHFLSVKCVCSSTCFAWPPPTTTSRRQVPKR